MLPLKKLVLFLTFFSLFSTASVKAQTIIPAEDGTGTIVTRDGKRITIDGGSLSQDGENLFHSFQEFGLSTEQIANFLANPQLQNILSRVTGGNSSVIRGLIEVSGGNPNLYLMNPAGIIFGENARLNVPADFTATTATGIGFENGWFNAIGENNYSELVGTPNQFIFNTENPSAIINAGDLSVSDGNTLSLFAGSIANTGTLTAQEGNIIVTAVPEKNIIRISQPGHILSLEITPPDTEAGEWNLSVYDLPALLTGNNSPEGLVVDENSQTVTLNETPIPTASGSNVIAGELDVSGETGGNIYVLGEKVGLYQAQLTAEGNSGGGNLFIGGDYQGEGTLPLAERTFVSQGSQLNANALLAGDGGQVIVWSEEVTAFSGEITAQGGEQAGNGGFVEVSGKEALTFNGSVDVSAPQGETGTILLDPQDIIIADSESSDNDEEISADGEILVGDGGSEENFTISDTALTSLTGNILLEASRDIRAEQAATLNFSNQVSGETVEFSSGRNITLPTEVNTAGAAVNFSAETGNINATGINTSAENGSGGAIALNAGGEIQVETLDTSSLTGNGGAVTINAEGEIITSNIFSGTDQETRFGGSITLEAAGNVTVENLVETSGGNFTVISSADVVIPATVTTEGGNIFVAGTTIDTRGGQIDSSGTRTAGSPQTGADNFTVTVTGDSDALAELLLGEGVTISDTELTGTENSVGTFEGGVAAGLGIESGVIITTGNATDAEGPNSNPATGTNNGSPGDDQLNQLIPESSTNDATIIEITFTTEGGDIFINYVFASEEYNEFVGSEFNDVFGFFLDGENIALVPETGDPISINTINNQSNPSLFRNNENGNFNIEYDGFTQVLTAQAENVEPGTRTIRLSIADTGDSAFDSAVLLEAGSFSTELQAGGDVTLEATENVQTGEILTGGGAINISSEVGNVDTTAGILDTSSENFSGGEININAPQGDILLQQLNTFSSDFNGGNINLIAGGNIDASAGDAITVDQLNDLQEVENLTINTASVEGNGGDITLEAGENLTIGFIDTSSEAGIGGDVNLTSTDGEVNATYTAVVEGDNLSDQTEVGLILSGSQQGDGGDVTITAQGDIRTGLTGTGSLENGTGGNITLNSETGNIDTTVGVSDLDPAFLEDLGLSPTLAEAATEVSINIGLLFSGSNEGTGGNVELTAQEDINTGMIITGTLGEEGGNVTLTSNSGSVNTSFDAIVDGVTEELLLEAEVDPELASLLDGVSVRPGIITFSEEAKGGNVTINANGDIITSNITTGSFRGDGGEITLNSETGSIDGSAGRFLENVSSELLEELEVEANSSLMTILDYFSEQAIGGYLTLSIDQNAGDINLTAQGDITTNYLIGSSFSGEGGNIILDTNNGSINIGAVIFNAAQAILPGNLAIEDEDLELLADLVSGGNVNSSGATGGEIQIGNITEENLENASGSITTGAINSSGRLGDGGDITIASDENIELSFLNAQAGENGTGGTINVTTEEFFRATETFLDQNEALASISSVGGEGGGEITIRHGAEGEIPFVVGDASTNGTLGEITSGTSSISEGSFPFTEEQGNISIISVSPEPEPQPQPQPEEREPQPGDPNPETLEEEPAQGTAITNSQSPVQIVSFDEAQAILQEIEQATAVKPALIYVNFVPQTLEGITDFQRQEAVSTQDYEQYFNLEQRKADVTLPVPRQASDQLELLLVTNTGEPYRVTVEGATREEVEQTTEQLYGLISSPPTPFARQAKPYLEPAQQLYDWIIEPLEARLSEEEIENLVFIMPSGLRLLPVAALHDGEQFLVEQYSAGFSPSLSLTDTRYRDIKDLEVLAAGASNFNDPTALGPLPAVQVELPTIANELWRGEFALNENFTLENFRQERRRDPAGIIHLATHADFRSGNPEEIYIQFYDEKVRLNDIRQLDLNDPPVELLVLSACRTAVGDEQVELGFAGLAVQAGVKSAMASLWYVGDTGTLGLMSEFYRQLNLVPIKAEAMRQAQVAMITGEVRLEEGEIIIPRGEVSLPADVSVRAEDLSHPYYWAAFTMVGSPW